MAAHQLELQSAKQAIELEMWGKRELLTRVWLACSGLPRLCASKHVLESVGHGWLGLNGWRLERGERVGVGVGDSASVESFAEVLEGWVGPRGLLLLWASFQALPTLIT